MAEKDGFGIDMSPLPGPGVTPEILGALQGNLLALEAAYEQLGTDVAAADSAATDLASWAVAVQNIVGMAIGLAQTYMAQHPATAGTQPHPSRMGTFIGGVLTASQLPVDQRQSAIVALLQGLAATM